jgi:hypothetical protein
MHRNSLVFAAALGGLLAAPAMAEVIPVGHFDQVGLEGGGHVLLKYGPTQKVTLLSGSTQYTTFKIRDRNRLEIKACNWHCPARYRLDIEIVTPNLDAVAIDGGGHIVAASGFPSQHELAAAIDGGGHLEMQALHADTVNAAIDGGGHIDVTAKDSLQAAIDGGGLITYRGDPQVTSAIDGGGTVTRASK